MAQLSYHLIANSDFPRLSQFISRPYPQDDFSTFILIFLSVQLADFSQFYTFRYFFAKDEISAEAEYIKVIDSGFSFPGSAQI